MGSWVICINNEWWIMNSFWGCIHTTYILTNPIQSNQIKSGLVWSRQKGMKASEKEKRKEKHGSNLWQGTVLDTNKNPKPKKKRKAKKKYQPQKGKDTKESGGREKGRKKKKEIFLFKKGKWAKRSCVMCYVSCVMHVMISMNEPKTGMSGSLYDWSK